MPDTSVAFQVRVIINPLITSVFVMLMAPLLLSVAVAEPVTDVAVDAPQETVTLAGQVITGFVIS